MITVEQALEALKYPHTLNYEKRAEITHLITAMQAAIKENHQHHTRYDDYDGYSASDLYDINVRFVR